MSEKRFGPGELLPLFCMHCGDKLSSRITQIMFDPYDGKPLGKQDVRKCLNNRCSEGTIYTQAVEGTGKIFPKILMDD